MAKVWGLTRVRWSILLKISLAYTFHPHLHSCKLGQGYGSVKITHCNIIYDNICMRIFLKSSGHIVMSLRHLQLSKKNKNLVTLFFFLSSWANNERDDYYYRKVKNVCSSSIDMGRRWCSTRVIKICKAMFCHVFFSSQMMPGRSDRQ